VGFIQHNEDEFREDTAEECYNQLVKRSLLQPTFLWEAIGMINFKDQCRCTT
jgi:hypothetical protein